jgi:histidine ammonia-lyase
MGMTAATKLREIVKLAEMGTAIELMTAAQGLEHHAPLAPGRGVKQAYEIVRDIVPPLTHDRVMAGDIERIREAIVRGDFDLLATN